MNSDLIISEFDRKELSKIDPDLLQFCNTKFEQNTSSSEQLIEDIVNEWVDDVDADLIGNLLDKYIRK